MIVTLPFFFQGACGKSEMNSYKGNRKGAISNRIFLRFSGF